MHFPVLRFLSNQRLEIIPVWHCLHQQHFSICSGTTSVLTYISGSASMGELISNEMELLRVQMENQHLGYYQAKIRWGVG